MNEMLDDIQEALLRKHTIKRNCKKISRVLLRLFAVLRLPRHITGIVCSDGSDFGVEAITNHVKGVVLEQGRDIKLVVPDLLVCFFLRGICVGHILELEQDHRDAVDEDQDIRALVFILDDRELVYDLKVVSFRTRKINKPYGIGAVLAILFIGYRDALDQILMEGSIPIFQP